MDDNGMRNGALVVIFFALLSISFNLKAMVAVLREILAAITQAGVG